jgi:hypothetical protein
MPDARPAFEGCSGRAGARGAGEREQPSAGAGDLYPHAGRSISQNFVARHIWRRRSVSPRRGRAYRRQRRVPLRGFLGLMATIVDLRHTARH